jgi:hypothetical protein
MRLEIYSSDIQTITGKSDRHSRQLIRDMKVYYKKQSHQIVTIREACKYLGINYDEVMKILFCFFFTFSALNIYSQNSFWSSICYFTPEEFYVNSDVSNIDTTLVRYIDEVRSLMEEDIIITSAVRSKLHNNKVGGVPNSSHMKGQSLDIKLDSPIYNAQLIENLFYIRKVKSIPIKFICYKSHIHLSINTSISTFTTSTE